jgi:hypothetical protein
MHVPDPTVRVIVARVMAVTVVMTVARVMMAVIVIGVVIVVVRSQSAPPFSPANRVLADPKSPKPEPPSNFPRV